MCGKDNQILYNQEQNSKNLEEQNTETTWSAHEGYIMAFKLYTLTNESWPWRTTRMET
jgi:hypothetical protein